ncbi:MAG TPA: TIM barrel protein [Roseiflexaceae bacterium]|nr:TIM barrel protein [Roseiflexaceae bacterium]
MPLHIGKNPIGLAAYSFPWRCGFAGTGTPRVCPNPLRADELLSLAIEYDLASLEIPLMLLRDTAPATLRAFRARADAHGITIVVDTPVIDEAQLAEAIPAAAALGARVVRVMLSSILEGSRTTAPGGWPAYLDQMIARLRRLRPIAEQHQVILAPENHQDATSADLIRVCDEVGGEYIGVTLDAVNPLAVAEEPIAFARALGSRIVDVHLKDYHIYPSGSGYRLVRCALGEGVLDLPALFGVLADVAPRATCNIARHIRIYEDDWWDGFGPRDVRDLLPVLRFVQRHQRSADEEWRTPWERDADLGEVGSYEEAQVARSVAYLRSLAE